MVRVEIGKAGLERLNNNLMCWSDLYTMYIRRLLCAKLTPLPRKRYSLNTIILLYIF